MRLRSLLGMRMGPHHMMPRDTEAVKDATLARDTARRVWGFARPYRGTILVFLMAIVAAALLALVPPLVVRRIIDVAIPNAIDDGNRLRSGGWPGSRSAPHSPTPCCRSCSGGAVPASARA